MISENKLSAINIYKNFYVGTYFNKLKKHLFYD